MTPTISVVMPCHDAAATLLDSVGSVRAQTRADWELICVDDGSSDATPTMLAALAAKEPRLRVVRQENAGPGRARNVGARLARGRILAFLDADDLWRPDKLASAAVLLDRDPEADAVFGRVEIFDGSAVVGLSASRSGPLPLEACLGENPICTLSNLTVDRDAFLATGGFDEGLRHAEDLAWLISAVSGGLRVVGTEAPHLRYRTSPAGLSSDLDAMHEGWRRAMFEAGPLPAAALRRAEARRFALRGLRLAPGAFLGGGHRGPATLLACLAAPLLPARLRRRAFS
jgi:glycosyltransferase involved in cell wall biosynthesis